MSSFICLRYLQISPSLLSTTNSKIFLGAPTTNISKHCCKLKWIFFVPCVWVSCKNIRRIPSALVLKYTSLILESLELIPKGINDFWNIDILVSKNFGNHSLNCILVFSWKSIFYIFLNIWMDWRNLCWNRKKTIALFQCSQVCVILLLNFSV